MLGPAGATAATATIVSAEGAGAVGCANARAGFPAEVRWRALAAATAAAIIAAHQIRTLRNALAAAVGTDRAAGAGPAEAAAAIIAAGQTCTFWLADACAAAATRQPSLAHSAAAAAAVVATGEAITIRRTLTDARLAAELVCSAGATNIAAAITTALHALAGGDALAELVAIADQRVCTFSTATTAAVVTTVEAVAVRDADTRAVVADVGGTTLAAASAATIAAAFRVSAGGHALADPVDRATLVVGTIPAEAAAAIVPARTVVAAWLTDGQLAESRVGADPQVFTLTAAPSAEVVAADAVTAGWLARGVLNCVEESAELSRLALVERDARRHGCSLDRAEPYQFDHAAKVLDGVVVRELRSSITSGAREGRGVTPKTGLFDEALHRLERPVRDTIGIGVHVELCVERSIWRVILCIRKRDVGHVLPCINTGLTRVSGDVDTLRGVSRGGLFRAAAGSEHEEQNESEQEMKLHQCRACDGEDSPQP
ncbi:MAG: hypothetical protein ACJAYU_000551 [Bradymonadia bacterium]